MHKKERRSTKIFCRPGKNARAQWLVFNGRYGVPPLFAIMPQGIDEATRQKYMDFARRCISNAAGVLPAGSDVKAVNPGATGPDTFSRLIDLSTQEMVLRATGGLMTMLTAPGAGTNTETGSAHQDAFDDLAAAEAEEIAAVLQESLFAPALDQWHPGQPHLVEFAMRRPDSDNATGTIANVASLATAGYRTDAAQVSDLTGLAVQDTGAPAAAQPTPGGDFPALRSLHTRFAPTMLYPPARAAFDRAINSRLAPSAPSPDASAPLTQAELEALQSLSKGFAPEQLEADADTIYTALADAISPSEEPDPTAENAKHPNGRECKARPGHCPLTKSKTDYPNFRHAREGGAKGQTTSEKKNVKKAQQESEPPAKKQRPVPEQFKGVDMGFLDTDEGDVLLRWREESRSKKDRVWAITDKKDQHIIDAGRYTNERLNRLLPPGERSTAWTLTTKKTEFHHAIHHDYGEIGVALIPDVFNNWNSLNIEKDGRYVFEKAYGKETFRLVCDIGGKNKLFGGKRQMRLLTFHRSTNHQNTRFKRRKKRR